MWPLAVNLSLVLLVGQGQLDASQHLAWSRVRDDILVVRQEGRVSGVAVLIDSRGYFVAHRSAIPGPNLNGQTSDGKTYKLTRLAIDDPTGLVLVSVVGWNRPIAPVQVGITPQPGAAMIAVLSSGPVSSEFVSGDRYGVVAPSQRLVPLVEVKFESLQEQVAGALIFDTSGRLLGALNATLEAKSEMNNAPRLNMQGQDIVSILQVRGKSFGPSQMTVAYSVSPDALNQVLAGFRSPSHVVWRPVMGIMCKDAPSGGAYVDTVFPNSPAERAGIRMGDIIFHVGGFPVKNQVSFAKAMLRQKGGSKLQVGLIRDEVTTQVFVILDKSKD